MADDGMLLNFSLGDGIINTQQKYKGGTWKDRLSVKKIALHRQNKSNSEDRDNARQKGGPGNPNRVEIISPRPSKRQRVDGDFKLSNRTGGQVTAPNTGSSNTKQNQARKNQNQPREIISSLFSFNPTPTSAVEPPKPERESDEPSKPSNAPLIDGIDTFTSLGLSPTLAAHLMTKLELKAPTAVQKSAISQLLKEECDAFIQAQTGSGKTLAYLLPLVQRLINLSKTNGKAFGRGGGEEDNNAVHRDSGLFAIILAPTRELCKQISVVLEQLLRCAHWIVAGTVIGGEKKKSEKARLRKGLNILVATPGRLADHLENTKVLNVSNVRWLVLDEGDRLMDLGFEEEIQGIVKKLDERQKSNGILGLPTKRVTILCSATLKMNVQRLGEISLKDAVHVQADPDDESNEATAKNNANNSEFSVPAQLKQSYSVVAAKLRLVTLAALMKRTFARKGSVMKAIVFVSCADSVDFHFEVFSRQDSENKNEGEKEGLIVAETSFTTNLASHVTIAKATAFSNPTNPVTIYRLHGSLPQHVRTSTLTSFARQSEAAVLICTDVAARGLDLPNVDFVIEYDPAFSADDHLHRIGRTARLGRDGRALIFLLPGNEEKYVEILKSGYRDGGANICRTDANETLKRGFGGNTEMASKGWEAKATEWQLDIERWALENPAILEMARRAYQSHIRAYATHIAGERDMFNIKDLHLGHLAKSFALRDRPAKINVPGLRPGIDDTKKEFKADRKHTRDGAQDDSSAVISDGARKMRAKLKEHMVGASEFNIA
ncbi:ATP-dependent RNA helicase DBP7 [Paracoccidioides brasiliensis Pb18]|uniref:ATP-dependent RNA helicase n=1 Tax=Paracoccidioides brasiliensis (strain Pb18) TaxID=502780 RepID=C1GDX8_PARBD|nr:ATP-dependent RNA helicase DBP7 [Paracoccidioides brasiliensis Pb18]EEH49385.1 ATP-dependent RNA helicase DBP7 [Paracoccidioides brasiliensis Pb18]